MAIGDADPGRTPRRERHVKHYSEADLLETYYTQPGASMPVMMHLADCTDCASRYERLEKKIHALAACEHDQPETFWSRQRIAVMRKIDARRSFSAARVMRVAAAALLAISLGIFATWRTAGPAAETPSRHVAETQTAQRATPSDSPMPQGLEESPWQSEELSDFHSMVAWESWVEPAGYHSL
jgi:hypothetical protein